MTIPIEEELRKIQERNKRVEADKAWETSLTRRIFLVVLTYCMIFITMLVLGIPAPYLSALIPTLGFFLSTLTLNFLKALWLDKIYRAN